MQTAEAVKPTSTMPFLREATEIMNILFEAQNSGKVEVMFEVAGHCPMLEVRIYVPNWQSKKQPSFSQRGYNKKSIAALKYNLVTYLDTL